VFKPLENKELEMFRVVGYRNTAKREKGWNFKHRSYLPPLKESTGEN